MLVWMKHTSCAGVYEGNDFGVDEDKDACAGVDEGNGFGVGEDKVPFGFGVFSGVVAGLVFCCQ